MDKQLAEQMTRKLTGTSIGGWLAEGYVHHGKSAAVFRAKKDGRHAALKIFDPGIIERYGPDAQRIRIQRECSLKGKRHPNLVEIYDGGEDAGYFYIAMEFFDGKNLADALQNIPAAEVRSLIYQFASAAKFLEDISFAHRDIKPENIGVSSDMKAIKLLDLGVMRPFDLSNITDEGEQKIFVGTLQYSPPELLFREEEENSIEAWRAITFYQLGAVLHDLLMKKPLFEASRNPYARLVRAVEREIPNVNAPEGDADLRLLAQNCLNKRPEQRLDTVKWEDFNQAAIADPIDAARRRIAQHKTAAAQASQERASTEDSLSTQAFTLRTTIFSSVVSLIKAENLPRYSTQVMREPLPYLLRIVFEPSTGVGLSCYFAVFCQAVVIDAATSAQELRISACSCSSREGIPAEPDAKAPSQFKKGALIEQDIRLLIRQSLIVAFACALDSNPGKGISWLNLGGGL